VAFHRFPNLFGEFCNIQPVYAEQPAQFEGVVSTIAKSFGPGYVVGARILLIEKWISSIPLRVKTPPKLARPAVDQQRIEPGEVGAILVN
jgi:hypothetical protein